MTLDTAEIDIGEKIFENGQTYVALSRIKTLNGVILKSFLPSKIKANKQVFDFYKNNNILIYSKYILYEYWIKFLILTIKNRAIIIDENLIHFKYLNINLIKKILFYL